MAKTLLAVDDSVTMRKVLEITFSGEDYRVITADTAQSAIGHLGESPAVAIIDASLGGDDGYELAKEVRKRSPRAAIVLLASRYAPYDQARGRDAGADDYADKPFDTQQLIDKVRKVVTARESGAAAPAVAAPPAAPPAPAFRAPPAPPPVAAAPPPVPAVVGIPRPAAATAQVAAPAARAAGLGFGGESAVETSAGNGVAAAAVAARPAPAAAPISGAVNGQLASKLGGLGLTAEQTEAVLALSREVVERVVWEVVPQLAETLIKEEIARLTKD